MLSSRRGFSPLRSLRRRKRRGDLPSGLGARDRGNTLPALAFAFVVVGVFVLRREGGGPDQRPVRAADGADAHVARAVAARPALHGDGLADGDALLAPAAAAEQRGRVGLAAPDHPLAVRADRL